MTTALLLIILTAACGLTALGLSLYAFISCNPRQRRQQLHAWQIALHEAGHAVIAWHSPVVKEVISVELQPGDQEREGHVHCQYWPNHDSLSGLNQKAIIGLAGRAAERFSAIGARRWHNGIDLRQVESSLRSLAVATGYQMTVLRRGCWQQARSQTKHYQRDIKRLAKRLIRNRRLERADLEKIIGPRQISH